MVRGQTWVDQLGDAALGGPALLATVEAVTKIVREAKDADQLRAKLVDLIATSDDPEAEQLLERLILLSTGMGTASSRREAET